MPSKIIPPEPTEAELRRLMGKSYAPLEAFLEKNADLRPEWKYYGVKLGWSLKLFQGKRNICFLGPGENYLGVSFVLGSSRPEDRKSTRLNSSHGYISYAVFCLKKKKKKQTKITDVHQVNVVVY